MLLVFDLDFTLWDAGGTWCDHILDGEGREIRLYPEVPAILFALSNREISIAIASRTHSPAVAIQLLELFGIRKYFQYEEIYPGSKIKHFQSLHKQTPGPYDQMYFFDDEYWNIVEVGNLGVHARLVENGLSKTEIQTIPGLKSLM